MKIDPTQSVKNQVKNYVKIQEGLRHSLPFQHGGKQCCSCVNSLVSFGFHGASLTRQLPKLRRKGYCITHFGCCITRKPRENIQVCVNVLPTSYRQVTDTLPTVGRQVAYISGKTCWQSVESCTCVSLQARRSANLLKQFAVTTVKQHEAESNDLDGIALLQTEPVPCVLNNEELKTADVPVLHCNDTVMEASSLPSTETRHSPTDVEDVTRDEICSPVTPLTRCRKKLAIKHGPPLNISSLFQISTSGMLQGPESTFVDKLIDGSVAFAGSKVIDSMDLVALRGSRPTSEENYLTNFVIESYLDLITKQGALQGLKTECIGWECFEKAVGRRPAKDILACNAPLLQQDIVLVPCNSENSQHWFLLALLPKQFQILVLDTLAGNFIKPTAKKAITKMWMLLNELDATVPLMPVTGISLQTSPMTFLNSRMTLTVESMFACMLDVWHCSTSYQTIYPVVENYDSRAAPRRAPSLSPMKIF